MPRKHPSFIDRVFNKKNAASASCKQSVFLLVFPRSNAVAPQVTDDPFSPSSSRVYEATIQKLMSPLPLHKYLLLYRLLSTTFKHAPTTPSRQKHPRKSRYIRMMLDTTPGNYHPITQAVRKRKKFADTAFVLTMHHPHRSYPWTTKKIKKWPVARPKPPTLPLVTSAFPRSKPIRPPLLNLSEDDDDDDDDDDIPLGVLQKKSNEQ
ncbi:hypothetical protein DFQ28_000910 [Apophysomyces sp. BC1034]|nr:hypothetical protein DFQ30_003083 [Apophysomyces sp. BC1015]KAG0180711.1 hypothetical protein DFQ29_000110 [Apophysomyces sp. BC1021]KAG0191111.1 hypothetical protein DFQ28_000910 [Apophysomyces sp. BC1034]